MLNLIILLTYTIINRRKNDIMNISGLIIISTISCFAINIVTQSSLGTPRMQYSIGAMIPLLYIYLYSNKKNNGVKEKILKIVMFTYIIIIVFCQFFITREHKEVNMRDKKEEERKMELKKNKNDFFDFFILIVITSVIFLPFLTGHYATDTYNIINMGYKKYALRYSLNDGRPIMCVISLLAESMNLSIKSYVILLTFISLILSCLSVVKMKKILTNYIAPLHKSGELIIFILSFVTIFNFAYLENLQFIECAVMSATIYIYIIVAQIIVERRNKFITKGIILSLISVLLYQGTINWLLTCIFIFSIIKEKKINKKVIVSILVGVFSIIISFLVDFIIIKISGIFLETNQNRIGNLGTIKDNIIQIIKYIPYVYKNTYELFPKNVFMLNLIILLTYTIINRRKNDIMNILGLIIISTISCFAINIVTQSSLGTPRMQYSIGAMIPLLYIYLYSNKKNNGVKEKILKIVMFTYIIIIVFCQFFITREHKEVNIRDKNESIQIGKWIKAYENEENIEVKKICFIYNNATKAFYKDINNKSSLCIKAMRVKWARLGLVNYYNGRHFEEVENDIEKENIKKYFKDKKWKTLEKEQLLFKGETLYYCLY